MWKVTTLGEYYDVRDGTHDSPKYVEEGYPLVTSKNLKNGKIDLSKIKYISEKDYQDINKRSGVDVGDVLMAMIGTIGNPVEIIELPKFAIKNVALFKTNAQQSPAYLRYFLSHPDTVSKMMSDAKGTTQKFVGLGYLRNFPISVPPLAEQERIVAKLDAAFAEIDKAISKEEVNEMENEKLRAKILSNFLHHKDWDKFKLNEICLIKNGGTPKTKIESYWGGDIKWLTPKDMGKINGKFASDSERKISNDGLKNSSAKLIPSESLILSCRAPIGHVFINKVEMSFNQGCKGLVINENEKVNVEYLYYFLLSSKKLLNDLGTGTTFKEISSKVLGNVEIALPVFHKQEEIIAKLNAAILEIENIKQFIESKKQNYAALKAAILSKEFQSSEAV